LFATCFWILTLQSAAIGLMIVIFFCIIRMW
jgi:hypothetical protein